MMLGGLLMMLRFSCGSSIEARCKGGDAIACDARGAAMITSDQATATEAFRAGCESKDSNERAVATCCYKLGLSYENGWGVPSDKTRAKALHARACAKSVREGCHRLGVLELDGEATDQK